MPPNGRDTMTSTINPMLRSDVESRRFGLEVYRGTFAENFSVSEILAQVFHDRVDVAILRVPCTKVGETGAFEQRGIPTITADTLVYYGVDLASRDPTPIRNLDLEFEPLSGIDLGVLDDIVARSFAGYTNHYSANPLLAHGLLPGYQEWARSFAESGGGERFGWVAKRGDRCLGFIACSQNGSGVEIMLNGVVPEAGGSGVYSDLVRFTQRFFKDAGHYTMKVSTQVQNFAVQKVWSREGFVMREAFATVHLNALLSASVMPVRTLPLVVTHGDLANFGRASGDLKPIHFDDEAARELGSEGRITHCIVATAFLPRFYSTEFPGEGTIFAGFRCSFLRPLSCDREYSVEISFPYHDPESGRWLSVARIFDSGGKPCLLAYSDLINSDVGVDLWPPPI